MSDVKIKEFAESIGVTVDRLVVQLAEAGVGVKNAADSISEEEKSRLLTHLRRLHGGDGSSPGDENPSRVTLNRRVSSKLKQPGVRTRRVGGSSAPPPSDVNVVVKKKRTYVKRAVIEEPVVPESAQVPGLVSDSEGSDVVVDESVSTEPTTVSESVTLEVTADIDDVAKSGGVTSADSDSGSPVEEPIIDVSADADSEEVAKTKPEDISVAEPIVSVETTEETVDKVVSPKPAKVEDGARKKEKKKGKLADQREDRSSRKSKNRKVGRKQAIQLSKQTNVHGFEKPVDAVVKEVEVGDSIVVSELASRMAVKAAELVKVLMNMGVMVNLNQVIDGDVATLAVEEMGHSVKNVSDATPENLLENFNEGGELLPRAPIVTVMGHVDHGKTSLLDRIRSTDVVESEAGGITQHIGAYHLHRSEGNLTFLDTPGHAAFSAMRARGAKVTDMVVLVVAADDGVKPQTVEAINHARSANVPIIVAVNKIDKPGADTDRVKQELVAHEVIPEEWGGDTMFVNVSAKTGEGLNNLLEVLLLQAEVLELSAVATGPAAGFIIESKLDRGRGAVASVIVTEGTLNQGDIVVAGAEFGRARSLIDENGKNIRSAGPSVPIQIVGLSGVPEVGDEIHVLSDERKAREIAEFRANRNREQNLAQQQKIQQENIFAQIAEGELKVVNVLIKADVHGSAEALASSLRELSVDEIPVKIVSKGVGGITESDVNLALASNAIIIGFNVRAEATARRLFQEKGVEVRYHSIIYEALDEIKALMSGLLEPEVRQQIIGLAEVKDVFRSSVIGDIAGCMVTEGSVRKSAPIRVLRDNIVVYEGELESLRRFKDEVAEVKSGVECGIGVKNYNNVQVGDQIEVFERIEVARRL